MIKVENADESLSTVSSTVSSSLGFDSFSSLGEIGGEAAAGLPHLDDDNNGGGDNEKVILKLVSQANSHFSVRISLKKTVKALIAGAAEHYKVPPEKIELQFDGEKMNPSAELSSYDLEDEDQLDIKFIK